MSIELTPEQRQALEAHPGDPVEVVDTATQRHYVLVPREQFDRLRALEPAALDQAPRQGGPTLAPLSVPQRLADLPTPPEIVQRARRHARKLGLWGKKYINGFEEELKLQYYYGGRHIRCLPTPQGGVVVAVHNGDDEDYQRQLQALTPQQRQRAVVMVPFIWNDPNSQMGDIMHHEG
jgi:hypothetical protein